MLWQWKDCCNSRTVRGYQLICADRLWLDGDAWFTSYPPEDILVIHTRGASGPTGKRTNCLRDLTNTRFLFRSPHGLVAADYATRMPKRLSTESCSSNK